VKPPTILGFIVAVYWIGRAGYDLGKHDADRYYAEHPVTLIAPMTYRVLAPQAQIEQPKEQPAYMAEGLFCSQDSVNWWRARTNRSCWAEDKPKVTRITVN
jgi:hypothetical protein